MRRLLCLLLVATGLAAPFAFAQSCAGFTDVPDTDPFCVNITWIKNRGITLGCTATTYCPDGLVNRKQMAAFLNRMAVAQSPKVIRVEQTGTDLVLTSSQVICQTPPQLMDFNRKYKFVGAFSAVGSVGDDILVSPGMAINAGAFGNLNQTNLTMSLSATDWQSAPLVSVPQPDPAYSQAQGNTYTWGILVQRAAGSSANLTAWRCYYFIELDDRPELG